MEFLRFGSSIPGKYWGCCAVDIIQDFNCDPSSKTSIQVVDGDGGTPLTDSKGNFKYLGPTAEDVFNSRLKIGTFSDVAMPNHVFLAVMTADQLRTETGRKWLKILHKNGFEFIRGFDNSVYSGSSVISVPGQSTTSSHINYLFGLFRNIGTGAVKNPFEPPKEWTALPPVKTEANSYVEFGEELNRVQQEVDLEIYKNLPPVKFYSEEELREAGVPVWLAGKRSRNPPKQKAKEDVVQAKADPFAV